MENSADSGGANTGFRCAMTLETKKGEQPIHVAARCGRASIAHLLLDARPAVLEAMDHQGRS